VGQLYSDLGGVFYCLFGNVTRRVVYEVWGARSGQKYRSVLMTFAVADGHCAEGKIDILNTEPQAFEIAHNGVAPENLIRADRSTAEPTTQPPRVPLDR